MDPDKIREQLDKLREQRGEHVDAIEKIVTAAEGESRDFTVAEAEQHGRLEAQVEHVDERIQDAERQLDAHEAEQRKQDIIREVRKDLGFAHIGSDGVAVTREHRTYERGNGHSYLRDLCMVTFGPGAVGAESMRALERLQRHGQENHVEALELEDKSSREQHEDYFLRQMVEVKNDRKAGQGSIAQRQLSYRALSTASSAGGEFVPPMYLTAEFVAYLRAGRVVADNCHHEDLPDGTMSINIPKVTGGTSVATQGTQNTNVSDTDLTTAYVTVPVVTKAGMQVVSLQLLERSPIQFDQVVLRDLAKAYGQQVDIAVINGPGSGDVTGILNTSGINTVTWTQASPTIKGLYGQIGLAKQDVATGLFMPATHGFMTPNAWEWIGQSFDSQNRPLVVPEYSGPFNAVQVAPDAATAEGAVGRRLSGLNAFEDANIPANLGSGTNQDVMIVSRMEENYLYESPIVSRALPQTYGAQLSVLLQLYGYIAFTAARYPNANSVITGTGMASANRTFNS